jgi:hypothetical protein
MSGDSIEGIYETLKRCALISKFGGGIGLNVHCIRAAASEIDGNPEVGSGLVPMLKNYNATATYVNQGGKVCFHWMYNFSIRFSVLERLPSTWSLGMRTSLNLFNCA